MSKIKQFFGNIKKKVGDFLYKNKFGYLIIITGVVAGFWDLFLKFMLDNKQMPVLENIFSIYSAHKTGGAWSIFSNATWLLIVFSVVFLVGLVLFHIFLKREKKSYLYSIAMGLLIGGAICNLLDRIRFGYVRDFIKLEFINFPVFNIADIAITVGVILLCVYFIILLPLKQKKLKEAALNQNLELIVEEKNNELTSVENTNLNNDKIPNYNEVNVNIETENSGLNGDLNE